MTQAVVDAHVGRRLVPVEPTDEPPTDERSSASNVAKHFQTSVSLLLKPMRRSVVHHKSVREAVLQDEQATAVERPSTPSALGGSPARSERTALSRFTQAHDPITVTEQELSCIRRVATYAEPLRPDGALVVQLPTGNYWLRHLHDPLQHKPPTHPLTLLNMPTDCRINGIPNIHTTPLISSPRSVLVLMRHGTNPLKLQQRLPIEDPHPASVEAARQEEMAFLQEEYRRLCAVLPQSTVSGFYEQLWEVERREREVASRGDAVDTNIPARPTIQADDSGIFRVVLRAETSAAEKAVAEKLARSRSRIENRLRSDVQLTQARTEASKVMQKKALAATKKHEAIAAQRKREQEAIQAERAWAAEANRRKRDELTEELRRKAVEAHERRMQRNEETEETNAMLREVQMERRRARIEAKQEIRERALEQARMIARDDAEELEAMIAQKDQVADQLKKDRDAERMLRVVKMAESEERFKARRQAMQSHSNYQAEVARRKQEAREACADKLLNGLKLSRRHDAAHREMLRLQRTLLADEKQAENAREEEGRIQELFARWEDAEARRQRLTTILDRRRQEKRFSKEVETRSKKQDQERWDAQRQFAAMLSADGMLTAQQRMEAVQRNQRNISINARKMEMEMSQWRTQVAEEARQTAEREEREVALSLFNEACPSDAVTLRGANQRSVRRITRGRKPLAPMEAPEELV